MRSLFCLLFTLCLFLPARVVLAHPGSGIVVDRQGNVYFIDTGSGIWKIDPSGKLTKLSGPAYHWMALDIDNRLSSAALPSFSRGGATVTRASDDLRILVSSDFPITIGPDGALYYPWIRSGDQLQIFRLAPSGNTTAIKTIPPRTSGGELRWLNGIVAPADGSLYYSEDTAIRKITPKGNLTTVIDNASLKDCESVPGVEAHTGIYFRGLDVDSAGSVYVAATGCRSVLRITPEKKVAVVLRAAAPWSPTAVAVSGRDLYVLEYLHTPGDDRREWLPRVRKVFSDGRVVTLAVIER